ncbi:DAK2 domain-containing protein [Dehalococcoides sp. THU3]|uniref:DAK2 domain-containing protein n=1 Tax=Dehalococcoides TaxID=61434 RepID=UPI0005B56951|nr:MULTISPECIES: DAK2 domain-containing protein [Dehalococcoides]QYY57776.1 DAK2 domain-containing protein [Dehalococcoides mccartyi]BAQ34988.1 hypothetical protein UCH007_10300 [Dehalococcoides sp. UCH007]
MTQNGNISGAQFRDMVAAATNWLEKSSQDIDALNVFPVPDGDTGTNMLLTMRSAVEETYKYNDPNVSTVALAIAKGSLMGARGNSGVILSQIWRGVSIALKDKAAICASDWAAAMKQASETAYQGLNNPVEGTILTVLRDVATTSQQEVDKGITSVSELVEKGMNAAGESVANTPSLLPALREAGVVDAGGQGFYTILEGALHFLRGEIEDMQFRKSRVITGNIPTGNLSGQYVVDDEEAFGYCTEFLLKGENMDIDKIRERLKKKGVSLIVVGDPTTVRVHIHTLKPGSVMNYVCDLGTMHKVSVRNMDEQHEDFLALQKERMPAVDTAIVAVVAGDGLKEVFKSLGAQSIISGGQTMNPSTKDILQAVEAAPSDKVIILPNNKNIILTAIQVENLTKKKIKVIPSITIPQGVAALLAFDYEADFETNFNLMKEAKENVKTIEITRAVRSTKLNDLNIKKKQAIGLLDDELCAVGDEPKAVLDEIISKLDLSKSEVITVYYGADTTEDEAKILETELIEKYPSLQVEMVNGGQPHYNYTVSIE